MILRILDDNKKNDWNEYVYNHTDSIAWHHYEWSEVVKKNYKVNFYPFAVYKGNRITGILPLYKVGNKLISVAYAVAGGILSDDKESQALLLDKAIKTADSENINKITFKQYKRKIDADLTTDENYYNKELDLTRPVKTIFNGFDKENKVILEAEDIHLYTLDFSDENINIFYKILFNHNHRNGLPCVSKKWIKDLIDFKMYEIALLKKGNNILAGTLIKKYKSTVSFPFSCTLGNKKGKDNYMYILYWLLIKKLSDEGIKIFHSGRIPRSNDVDIYRLGWGGTPYTYYYQYYPKNLSKTEFKIKRGNKRKFVAAIWKMSPKFVTKILSPQIIKRFP